MSLHNHRRTSARLQQAIFVAAVFVTPCVLGFAPRVAVYQNEEVTGNGWSNGPDNVRAQLDSADAGAVELVDASAKPRLAGLDALLIPGQHSAFYSGVEVMSDVQAFVANGGLVLLLSSSSHGAAENNFVSQALDYQGEGCERARTMRQVAPCMRPNKTTLPTPD